LKDISVTYSDNKVVFIDNLKIVLTILVVFHHSLITYGAAGSWYFVEATSWVPATILMSIVILVDMTFFMGFFFFLSSCFTEKSLTKKGPMTFLLERLKRLGIPLAFYSIVLSPSLNYMAEHYGRGEHDSFFGYMSGYKHWIDFGVMWFVAALLLFSVAFVLLRTSPESESPAKRSFPGDKIILGFSLILGLITYVVRGFFPIGWTLFPLNFQLAYFPEYIALFYLGIVSSRNSWFENLALINTRRWLTITVTMIAVVLPLLHVLKASAGVDDYSVDGHFHWMSLLFAEWEQITGISIIVSVLGIASRKLNQQTSFGKILARTSYGVYILHPLVLVVLALLAQRIQIEPLIKLVFVFPLAVVCTYLLSYVLTRVPGVNRVV
jgi:surface polysaccharide O-acyltransferase-like enzyme